MTDQRVERARRLASYALELAGPAVGPGAGPRVRWNNVFRRPVRRRAGEIARRELVTAAAYDRGALLRAADLLDEPASASAVAQVARTLLLEAAASMTSR